MRPDKRNGGHQLLRPPLPTREGRSPAPAFAPVADVSSITAGTDGPPPTGWPADDTLRRRVTSRRCLHRAPGSVWACGRRAVGATERCPRHLGDLGDAPGRGRPL